MKLTKAIVALEPMQPLHTNWSLQDVSVGVPGEGEVLVEICATGICHTDILLSAVPAGTFGISYPKVVGHEGSGIVRAIGPNIKNISVGDPVLMSYHSCSSCNQCRNSHPAYCDSFAVENYVGQSTSMTLNRTGEAIHSRFFGQSSFSRYSVVSEKSIVNIRGLLHDEMELKLFAPLGCGFQTGMGAVCNTSNAGPSDSVMIIGLGAVGMGALMAAKIRNCAMIIAVDRVDSRLEEATALGANHTINTATLGSRALSDAVQSLTPGGPSIVIDTAGAPVVLEEALESMQQRGKLVLIGVPPLGYKLPLNVITHINKGHLIIGCIEGDCIPSKSIPQMITWYREGLFPIDKLVQYYKITDYEEAVAQLKKGAVVKPVLTWE
ncbi:chaperonin 10-like protein [Aspergillus pseudodeflectus]|uniref:Chaperonin 10-like protein n=1 Tax=Aspergillus pseudodeflectus TaxID=176178 RepID=A0ABR4JBZ0_9EURO